jgi:Lon protease-like protein
MEDCTELSTKVALPPEMPVMVLPDCHLFPGCLLPLYIFEERYRLLLAHALGANRMFCIGNREGSRENAPVSEFTTAGLVRCCVKQDDGTSHLLLLGLRRVRITGWTQMEPFRIAKVEAVKTVIGDLEDAMQLKAKALGLFNLSTDQQAKELRKVLAGNDNVELVCDVLSYHFTRCPKLQQRLLGEESLEKRFELLIAALEKSKCE